MVDTNSLPRGVLNTIGQHIERGPYTLRPVDAPQGYGLVEELRLAQFPVRLGQRSTIALFVPTPESFPASLHCVFRRVQWLRDGSAVHWPDIGVSFFRVLPEDFEPLSSAVRRLDLAVATLRVDSPGIDFEAFYSRPEKLTRAAELEDVSHFHERRVFHAAHPEYELSFFEKGEAAELNSAWELLWSEMEHRCRQKETIECVETYELEPERLRNALLADRL